MTTWEGKSTIAKRDRTGGILISHDDGTNTYVQPGDDANQLAYDLDACGDDDENIDALLCDYLEGL